VNHKQGILCLFIIAATIMGTAGYSTIQSDRIVDVQVAGDDEAYLVIDETKNEIDNGSTGEPLELTNQFAESVELSISVKSTEGNITSEGLNDTIIDTGEAAALQVKCEDTQTSGGIITVDITADGDEISFETSDRDVKVKCSD
jgi:hypothetical protein